MVRYQVTAMLSAANVKVSEGQLETMIIGITWFYIMNKGLTINQILNYLYF